MSETLTVTRNESIVVLILDNPPVNALSLRLREELYNALLTLRDDTSVRAVVIACAGRTFVAGADIAEFGKPTQGPPLRTIIEVLERIRRPTIAAIHGTTLGGGLELAMGCHYRVAQANAKLGLPEVTLGLLPGAGGTQRLPRLIGPMLALHAILSGAPMSARQAFEAGLVDAIFEGDLLANAQTFAREASSRAEAPPVVSRRNGKLLAAEADLAYFDAEVAKILRGADGIEAMVSCAQAVRNSMTMPFEQAMDAELRLCDELLAGEQSRALRHLFFAARQAAKIPGLDRGVTPRDIGRVGIVGASTMAGEIAMSFANSGLRATTLDPARHDRAELTTAEKEGMAASCGAVSWFRTAERGAMVDSTIEYDDLADCDLIIDATSEEMELTKTVFTKLLKVAKPGAILTSTTSHLHVDQLGNFTCRPGGVIGLHFFPPINSTKLLEINRTSDTEPEVLATALSVGKALGKVPVVVSGCRGSVGVSMLSAGANGMEYLVGEGAYPEQIDEVFADFGWAKGSRLIRESASSPCQLRRPTGHERQGMQAQEVIERVLYPIVNQGARLVEDGTVIRSSDIDVLFVNGLGFPAVRGGPMFWADRIGIRAVVSRLDYWCERTGSEVHRPASLLRELAVRDGRLTDYSKSPG